MERLTTKVVTTKDNVDFQRAMDKLSVYEDAEESGRLAFLPERIWYIHNNCIYEGTVLEATCKAGFAPTYLVEHKHADTVTQLRRVLNVDAFDTEVAAKMRFDALYSTGV